MYFRPLTEEELQDRRVEARRRHAEIVAQRENAAAKDADDGKEAKISDSQQTNGHTYLESEPLLSSLFHYIFTCCSLFVNLIKSG